MKSIHFSVFSCLALAFNASGAIYTTDFNSYANLGADVVGQDDWEINDTTDQFSAIDEWDPGNAPPSNAIFFGDASVVDNTPTVSKVVLSHDIAAANSSTTVSFDFALIDSFTGAFSNRDSFGMSLSSGGANVLSIAFVPEFPTPANPDNNSENSNLGAKWTVFYTAGLGSAVQMGLSVFEGATYDFFLSISENVGNPLLSDFALTVTGSNPLTVGATGLDIDPAGATDSFGLFWEKNGSNDFGSNLILVDNLTVVPEPSSCLLLGLAGMGFVFRRVRA